jgi:hypothetical protein
MAPMLTARSVPRADASRMRRVGVSAGTLIALAALVAAVPSSVSAGRGIRSARHFSSFSVYFAGDHVLKRRLAHIDIFGDGRGAEVTAFYGRCRPQGGGFCSYPLEVRNTSICRTYPGAYVSRPKLRRIDGTWGGWINTARIFDVYTGHTTVSVLGESRRKAERVAKRLKNVRIRERAERLPDVKAKFLKGKARCQRGRTHSRAR